MKVTLDNELTTIARSRLRQSNPSVFVSRDVMRNWQSKDP